MHRVTGCLAFGFLLSAAAQTPLIIDTDMGGGGAQDLDDVVALCVANSLADQGEADLLAVVVDSLPPQACE